MINICTPEQLQLFIEKKLVRGCGYCRNPFTEMDLIFIMKTERCPHCGSILAKVATKSDSLSSII